MFKLSFNVKALTDQIDELDAKVAAAVRPAAQAAAQVLYAAVRQRAGTSRKGYGSGRLQRAIYQKYIPERSVPEQTATYYVSWRRGNKGNLTGLPTAPHGNLVEYGYWQRYVMVKDHQGQFIGPAVRPHMQGKPKPKRGASQATKDAYYVTLPGGPIWHPPQSFLRASESAIPAALDAALAKFQELVK